MTKLVDDWRWFLLAYVTCAGVWGVLAKFASRKLDSATLTFLVATSACVVMGVAAFPRSTWRGGDLHEAAAVLAGVLGGVGSLAFYAALKRGPVNVVVPLASLHVVLAVVLSCLFLGEALGPKRVLGIAFAVAAIVLLGG